MNVDTIATALRVHNGTWDSWGWSCRGCNAGERFAPVSDEEAQFAEQGHEAFLRHQAEVVVNG